MYNKYGYDGIESINFSDLDDNYIKIKIPPKSMFDLVDNSYIVKLNVTHICENIKYNPDYIGDDYISDSVIFDYTSYLCYNIVGYIMEKYDINDDNILYIDNDLTLKINKFSVDIDIKIGVEQKK